MSGSKPYYQSISGVTPWFDVKDESVRQKAKDDLDRNKMVNRLYVNDKTGFHSRYELLGWIFDGPYRSDMPDCSKHVSKTHPRRCEPIKGGGVSRRCPNTDRGCQFFFNYQKFLQCWNKFEHLGGDAAEEKCGFYLRGVPPSVQQWYQDMREDGDWLGLKSNYNPNTGDDDDDDEDF